MPVGIDMELFKKIEKEKIENSVLFLGRISPSKKPDLVVEALNLLNKDDISFTADFCGSPLLVHTSYDESLKEKVKKYKLGKCVSFQKGIPNSETPAVYNAHEIFINPSPSGMYDKTIFEAMACECLILTSNLNLKGQIDDIFLFKENSEKDMAKQLKNLLNLDAEIKEKYGKILRTYAVEHHSIERLARELTSNLIA